MFVNKNELTLVAYLRRLGAHTRARFLECMFVLLLNEAICVKCLLRYSKVLWEEKDREKFMNKFTGILLKKG